MGTQSSRLAAPPQTRSANRPELVLVTPADQLVISGEGGILTLTNATATPVCWKVKSQWGGILCSPARGMLAGSASLEVKVTVSKEKSWSSTAPSEGKLQVQALPGAESPGKEEWKARASECQSHGLKFALAEECLSKVHRVVRQIGRAIAAQDDATARALLLAHADHHQEILDAPFETFTLYEHVMSEFPNVRWAHLLLTGSQEDKTLQLPPASAVQSHPSHLSLGVTASGFRRILELFGFWKDGEQVNDATKQRKELGLEFADALSPGVVVGYDLQKIIKIFTERNLEEFSLCEVMFSIGDRDANTADRLLSHAQMEPLHVTLEAMQRHEVQARRPCFFFLDYPSLRQCKKDFIMEEIERSMRQMSAIVLVLDPIEAPETLKRIFCLFEVGVALRHGLQFEVVLPERSRKKLERLVNAEHTGAPNSRLLDRMSHVSMEAADIRPGQEKVKDQILQRIRDTTTVHRAESEVGALVLYGVAKLLSEMRTGCSIKEGTFVAECAARVQHLHPDLLPQILLLKPAAMGGLLHVARDNATTVQRVLALAEAAGVTRELLAIVDVCGLDAVSKARSSAHQSSLPVLEAAAGLAIEPKLRVRLDEANRAQVTLTNVSGALLAFDVNTHCWIVKPASGVLEVGGSSTLSFAWRGPGELHRSTFSRSTVMIKYVHAYGSLAPPSAAEWAAMEPPPLQSQIYISC